MPYSTDPAKSDLAARWCRPDRVFFAKGACHVLAGVFLRRNAGRGFRAVLIWPGSGFHGSHVFVTNGTTVFDWHGYSDHGPFVAHSLAKLRRQQPGWTGELIAIEGSPAGAEFCARYKHRQPGQFYGDVIARAERFLGETGKRASRT